MSSGCLPCGMQGPYKSDGKRDRNDRNIYLDVSEARYETYRSKWRVASPEDRLKINVESLSTGELLSGGVCDGVGVHAGGHLAGPLRGHHVAAAAAPDGQPGPRRHPGRVDLRRPDRPAHPAGVPPGAAWRLARRLRQVSDLCLGACLYRFPLLEVLQSNCAWGCVACPVPHFAFAPLSCATKNSTQDQENPFYEFIPCNQLHDISHSTANYFKVTIWRFSRSFERKLSISIAAAKSVQILKLVWLKLFDAYEDDSLGFYLSSVLNFFSGFLKTRWLSIGRTMSCLLAWGSFESEKSVAWKSCPLTFFLNIHQLVRLT